MGSDGLQELFSREFLVGVKIRAPDNGVVVLVCSLSQHRVKEPLEILLVDIVEAAVINRVECGVMAEPLRRLQLLLELFRVSVHFDFHQDELGEFFFDVKGQVVVLAADHVGSLSGLGSQPAVGARQDDLHEVRVVEVAILVGVEELDQVVTVCLSYVIRQSVISDEI